MEIKQIGVIHTPFAESEGTPVQPSMSGSAVGRVEVFEEYAEGLKDLDGFDRVWLLFWCDRACKDKLTVVPYRDDCERGVFATRAPCRPNPIGMSSVRILGIEDNMLSVEDVDILDGTPLIDIKPYVTTFDVYDVERCGWLDTSKDTRTADNRFQK